MDSLTTRVEELETLVLALGVQAFGDNPGHDFHGNQWTATSGGSETRTSTNSYGEHGWEARDLSDKRVYAQGIHHDQNMRNAR